MIKSHTVSFAKCNSFDLDNKVIENATHIENSNEHEYQVSPG
ncbi:hypothetical protein VCHA50P415_20822 [Vibrio chagasii]|nr:hypothetical protein VCHA34P112_110011 [Vibrio chagasii]CAH6803608.1 hypothetical protein VCHA34P120_100231 [Vibrio chagasii]CAH6814975.1 hypothetical protein VCHA29O39_120202 [Vibrio chagasii]CAH6815436.1 hypothetical protein VCHA28O22_150011 [Vibrio chagasii]CAH6816922.1 hypothetical protein VCHA35O141_140118 [Vibrio chagasii]